MSVRSWLGFVMMDAFDEFNDRSRLSINVPTATLQIDIQGFHWRQESYVQVTGGHTRVEVMSHC